MKSLSARNLQWLADKFQMKDLSIYTMTAQRDWFVIFHIIRTNELCLIEFKWILFLYTKHGLPSISAFELCVSNDCFKPSGGLWAVCQTCSVFMREIPSILIHPAWLFPPPLDFRLKKSYSSACVHGVFESHIQLDKPRMVSFLYSKWHFLLSSLFFTHFLVFLSSMHACEREWRARGQKCVWGLVWHQ